MARKSKPTAILNLASEARGLAPLALRTLQGLLTSKDTPAATKAACCKEVLDRGYGRAVQAVEHSGGMRVETVSDHDLARWIARELQQAEYEAEETEH